MTQSFDREKFLALCLAEFDDVRPSQHAYLESLIDGDGSAPDDIVNPRGVQLIFARVYFLHTGPDRPDLPGKHQGWFDAAYRESTNFCVPPSLPVAPHEI